MMLRCRRAADALWPTAMLWATLVVFAFWRDAAWPHTWPIQQVFLVWALAAEYFLLKAAVIFVHAEVVDSLAVTIFVINSILALAFFLQMAGLLWPVWAVRNQWINQPVLWLLIVGFAAGIIELALVPPPDKGRRWPP